MQQSTKAAQSEKSPPVPPEAETRAYTAPSSVMALPAWLTLERAAYLGLVLLALVLRLVHLGVPPLSDNEAAQALVAWRVYQSQPVQQAGYSPLLVTLNLLSFGLLGGTEFAARLGSTLLGVALVLLPYGLRTQLGRSGALFTSALFALSPTVVYFSRVASGEMAAAVGGLALTVGFFGWLDSLPGPPVSGPEASDYQPSLSGSSFRPSVYLFLAAAGLVLLLTASPSSYSTLALLVGFLVLAVIVGGGRHATTAREGLRALRLQRVSWGNLGLALGAGFFVAATGLLINLGGLAASSDLLTTWLLGFAPSAMVAGAYPAVFLLSLYEPLILLAGLFGLSVGLLRRRLIDLFLAWWFFGGIALNLLRPGRMVGETLVSLVPLTLLAGMALGMLWDALRREGSWQKEGIIAVTGLVIGGYALVSLMSYTRTGGMTVWLPVAGLGLFAVLVALFWVWYDGSAALRGAALVAVVLLAAFAVATGSRLLNQKLADPHQPLVYAPAAEGIPAMRQVLEQVSSWRAGDAHLLNIVADRHLGPAIEWQLRSFPNVTWVDRLDRLSPEIAGGSSGASSQGTGGLDDSAVYLTLADQTVSSEDSYVGQDFAIRAAWSPAGLQGQSLIRWILLREAPTPADVERAVLWVPGSLSAKVEEPGLSSGESVR